MVKITIDEKVLEVDPHLTIIQAASQNGIHIPHFCWHPKLSVSGNCRICLVEVEKMPKLVIACATQVADGMIVSTKSERVVNARNAVMEFLLINHPLDCPICDEAGECKLQDYAYKFSIGASRFQEDKVHKPKRVELGPNVILDVERCIMCSRCIRFSEEIAHQTALTFTERGTHVVLTTFPGTKLDNPYSMNVIDICPVGALTSRDFRFKARVWEMSSTPSVCVGCARGCNMNIWVRNNEILRLTPRKNEEVNSFWMCDYGRTKTFKSVASENRLNGPLIRKNGKQAEVGWDEAISKVVSELRTYRKHEIAGIGSAYTSNEDNYLFAKLMKEVIGTKNTGFLPHMKSDDEDDFLIRADKTPNSYGALTVGLAGQDGKAGIDHILKGISAGDIKVLYVLEDNVVADPQFEKVLSNLELLIVHSPLKNETTDRSDIVFPASTFAEKNGTITNFQGRVQRLRPAVALLDHERALDGMQMSRLDKFTAQNDTWGKGIKRDARSSWRIIATIASAMGAKMKYAKVEEVFKEMADRLPAFKGLTYAKIGNDGALVNETVKKHTQKVLS
jgi:NADH-quinone oxidoreductase subunit G